MYGNIRDVTTTHHHLLPSSSAGNPNSTYPLLHHHHQLHQAMMIPLPPPLDDEFRTRDERLPPWSNQETRDLIETRAQVELAAKTNSNLWEMVADRMRDRGYWRTADHCKWKWKNLVAAYKGDEGKLNVAMNLEIKVFFRSWSRSEDVSSILQEQEASNVDTVHPFFNELHAVFTARANRIQAEAETVRLNGASGDQSNEEFTEEQKDDEEVEVDHQAGKVRAVPKRKAGTEKRQKTREPLHTVIGEIMRNFMQQQQMIDMEWRASMEKRAEERERFEHEWQQKMERLEREKLMMEQAWREREEERRVREESRAEQRDALLTALLNKLIHEDETA
ncbi:hypothetical protein SASPL_131230 [Salvia splendens]|uniref:Myb-like domain-containing protein n=1 Tax=Salvia splendens TaxID=180675 RepID=A0A8X8XAK6_SALSN|nr:hypothetical protein SASPL_131230 [Salvia splendens]